MRIRDFVEEDTPRVMELFSRHGFGYNLPDPASFFENQVLVDDSDKVIMILAAQSTADIYLLVDDTWETPGLRLEALKVMHEEMRLRLLKRGVIQVHAWLPPGICRSFGSRLMRTFGWAKPLWTCFARKVEPIV